MEGPTTGKRRLPDDGGAVGGDGGSGGPDDAKRARTMGTSALVVPPPAPSSTTLAVAGDDPFAALRRGASRTSSLAAPIMALTGHAAGVTAVDFAPGGAHLASASRDRSVFLWNVFGATDNYGVLRGHKNAVLDVCWAPGGGGRVFTASADKTAGVWDAESGARTRVLAGHDKIVNAAAAACEGAPFALATASDDGSVRLWDARARAAASVFRDKHPLLAVACGADGGSVFAAGVDNVVRQWDARRGAVALALVGHGDTVTGLRVSPDGGRLASQAMDGTVRLWDVRPFVPDAVAVAGRCVGVLGGVANNFEALVLRPAWAPDGERVAAGCAVDRCVYVWDVESGRLEYRLPGHAGVPVGVAFHPSPAEPILASAGADKRVFLGELEPSAK